MKLPRVSLIIHFIHIAVVSVYAYAMYYVYHDTPYNYLAVYWVLFFAVLLDILSLVLNFSRREQIKKVGSVLFLISIFFSLPFSVFVFAYAVLQKEHIERVMVSKNGKNRKTSHVITILIFTAFMGVKAVNATFQLYNQYRFKQSINQILIRTLPAMQESSTLKNYSYEDLKEFNRISLLYILSLKRDEKITDEVFVEKFLPYLNARASRTYTNTEVLDILSVLADALETSIPRATKSPTSRPTPDNRFN